MTIIDHIKNYIEFIIFILLQWIIPKPKPKKGSLILINTGEIGDLVVSSVLLENPFIFKNYSRVKFLIKENYLELFNDYNGEIKFIGYNYKKYKYSIIYKIKLIRMLRQEGFSTCIHLTAARGILNEEITHLIGASKIVALNSFGEYLGEYLGKYFDRLYTDLIGKELLNEYDKHIELMKYLTNYTIEQFYLKNRIVFKEDSKIFQDFSDSIIIAPYTSLMNREWNKEYFIELINILKQSNKIVLIGSGKQRDELNSLNFNDENVIVLAGILKLNEIPTLLSSAKLFIGMDSGTTHIALKMDIPIIANIGGGEFGRFFPYGNSEKVKYLFKDMDCFLCHWKCNKKEMYCLTNISPQDILDSL